MAGRVVEIGRKIKILTVFYHGHFFLIIKMFKTDNTAKIPKPIAVTDQKPLGSKSIKTFEMLFV